MVFFKSHTSRQRECWPIAFSRHCGAARLLSLASWSVYSVRSVSISAYSAATRARRYQERKRSVQRDECRFVLTVDLFLSLSLFVALTSPAQAPVKREIVNSESVGKDKAVVCVSPRERSDKAQSHSRTLAYRPPPLIHTPLYSLANPPVPINMH